jgi:hypothetical protein
MAKFHTGFLLEHGTMYLWTYEEPENVAARTGSIEAYPFGDIDVNLKNLYLDQTLKSYVELWVKVHQIFTGKIRTEDYIRARL